MVQVKCINVRELIREVIYFFEIKLGVRPHPLLGYRLRPVGLQASYMLIIFLAIT